MVYDAYSVQLVEEHFCSHSSIEDGSMYTGGSGAKMAKDTPGCEEVAKAIFKLSCYYLYIVVGHFEMQING